MLENLFLDFIFAVAVNLPMIVLGVVSVIFAVRGKNPWVWYSIGAAIQAYAGFGIISGMMRAPDLWITREHIISLVSRVAFALVFAFIINRARKH